MESRRNQAQLPVILSQWNLMDITSRSRDVRQHVRNVANQGSSCKPLCPWFLCVGGGGGQSHRHGVELNYSKLQSPVGQTVWSKAPGIQRPLTINHISITYLAWPKASDMQRYSCQVELLYISCQICKNILVR